MKVKGEKDTAKRERERSDDSKGGWFCVLFLAVGHAYTFKLTHSAAAGQRSTEKSFLSILSISPNSCVRLIRVTWAKDIHTIIRQAA